VPKQKPSTIKLQVFKGREAKLNKTIFRILANKGPQTIYNIHKQIRTQRGLRQVKYASVNKRIRSLVESGYVTRLGTKRTKTGLEVFNYDVAYRALLAILIGSLELDATIAHIDDSLALILLGDILNVIF
jgi:DNA-binding Lrp family transcriptional regulator